MKKHTKKIGAFLLKKRQIATKILTKVLRFPFVFNSYFLPKNKPEVGKLEPLINCRNIGPKCGSFFRTCTVFIRVNYLIFQMIGRQSSSYLNQTFNNKPQ